MNINLIDTIIKTFGINLCAFYILLKILNYNKSKYNNKISILFIITVLFSITILIAKIHSSFIPVIIFLYLLYAMLLSKTLKIKFEFSISITIIATSISYIIFFIAVFIVFLINYIFKLTDFNNPINFIVIFLISSILAFLLFKIKKFKNGFSFFNTNYEYIELFILHFCIIVISIYTLFGKTRQFNTNGLFILLIVLAMLAIPVFYKTFILYQKQKLQTQTLKDYETELTETKQKLQAAQAEKQTLIKSNHEFYHRQEAIKKKLDDLAKQYSGNYNTEFAEELGNISVRLNKMSDEYISKTNFSPALPKANIDAIDDMLSYMKSECDKNNIEFTLKIDCDINHIINNFISTSQLETLLGDLIRNSIIAVNHSTNNYRSIMVIFGIKNSIYELCVLDSGIPFEIDTLLNLGLSPASTHLDEGGTGIGFITTFETVKSCNGSITINEVTNNNYSKSIEVQFDNKNEYRIVTQRKESIVEKNINNRDIVLTETL